MPEKIWDDRTRILLQRDAAMLAAKERELRASPHVCPSFNDHLQYKSMILYLWARDEWRRSSRY